MKRSKKYLLKKQGFKKCTLVHSLIALEAHELLNNILEI